jgi:predicted aconitase
MTNSGKYAHYSPALTGRKMRFASLDDCLKAACGAEIDAQPPLWLRQN